MASEQKLVIGGQNFEEQTHTWLIREADKKDVKAFETLYNDDEVKRFLPYPLEKQAQTCKDWEDWIESLHQYVYPSEEPSMWVLADENDDMIGRIGLEYKEKDEESVCALRLLPTISHSAESDDERIVFTSSKDLSCAFSPKPAI